MDKRFCSRNGLTLFWYCRQRNKVTNWGWTSIYLDGAFLPSFFRLIPEVVPCSASPVDPWPSLRGRLDVLALSYFGGGGLFPGLNLVRLPDKGGEKKDSYINFQFQNSHFTLYMYPHIQSILRLENCSSLLLAPPMFTLNLGHSPLPPPELDAVFFGRVPGGRVGSP